MSAIEVIEHLYAQIPTFQCKPGCTDCCGPVPFARSEWARVADKRIGTCLHCPYGMNNTCDIYDQRPFICRLFGAVDDERLKCPHGCGRLIPLTKDEGLRLMHQYKLLEHTE